MASTTNYSWTTPDDTDLVKDGAAAIRTLGSAIDTTVFNNAGAAVAKTTIDAKGDLLVGTANDTISRLAVGTNNYVLTADSAEASGVKWAAVGAPAFVGASVGSSGAQSINHDTQTVVTWDTENFDTDAFHSTSTNTGRFTIPAGKGGKYLITATGFWSTDTVGNRYLYLQKNGTDYVALSRIKAENSNPTTGGSIVIDLVATDYVQVTAYQNSGGAQNFNTQSTAGLFTITYLGA